MMKTHFIPLFGWFLLLSCFGLAHGADDGVEARLTSQPMIEIKPGQIVTGSYLISNHTGADEELFEGVRLPGHWQLITGYPHPIKLGAKDQKVRLVAFSVPRNCPAGRYEIIYMLTDREDSRIRASAAFSVVVLPVVEVNSVIEHKPKVVMAGDQYGLRLRVVNRGNSTTELKVKVTGNPAYPVIVEPAQVILQAGKSQLLSLLITTDPKLRDRTNHILQIDVQADAPKIGAVSTQQTVSVEILPRLTTPVDARQKIPSQIRFITVGGSGNNNGEDGFQVEYSGSGSLDENGRRRIGFVFRGPDVQDRSVYGTRDVLRFNYADQRLDLRVGDRGYQLSPLTEQFYYGRGAEAAFHRDGVNIGSFYVKNRWDRPQKKEVGAYAGYKFSDRLQIKGNFLHKRRENNPSGDETKIYTIQMNLKPGTRSNLGLEYGRSLSDKSGKSTDFGYRVALDGLVSNRIWYTLQNIYAGANFFGYFNDVFLSSGTVTFPIYRSLQGNLSYRTHKQNLDLDPTRNTANREKAFRGVLSYSFRSGTSVSLDYEVLRRKDELLLARYDFNENTWRLGFGQLFRRLGLQTYTERATFENKLLGTAPRTLERYSIHTYFRPSPQQTYTIFTTIGHSSFTGNPARSKHVGISALLGFRNVFNLNITYRKNNADSEKRQQQDHLLSTLAFRLPNRHTLSLRTRWVKYGRIDNGNYSFFAAYTIPLNIPAGKKKGFGVLMGRIFDRDKEGAPPLPNAILRMDGLATVTNQKGEFVFPALKPGHYSLRVDQRSIGLSKITSGTFPISVEIKGGETTVRDIGVAAVCRVSGKVAIYAFDSKNKVNDKNKELFVTGLAGTRRGPFLQSDLTEVGRLSSIWVELSSGEEILRQFTDERGRFSFEGLEPGAWQLKVYDHNLPPHHYLEKSSSRIELVKGEEKKVAVKVLPRLRSIRMIEGGK